MEKQIFFAGIELQLCVPTLPSSLSPGPKWDSLILRFTLIVPGEVMGNSNNFTFFPVLNLRDVEISLLGFYECVRIVWVYVGRMNTPKVKHFSPLFIISPSVLPILSVLSPISMLNGNSSDYSR